MQNPWDQHQLRDDGPVTLCCAVQWCSIFIFWPLHVLPEVAIQQRLLG